MERFGEAKAVSTSTPQHSSSPLQLLLTQKSLHILVVVFLSFLRYCVHLSERRGYLATAFSEYLFFFHQYVKKIFTIHFNLILDVLKIEPIEE